jgi:hypothetical protein
MNESVLNDSTGSTLQHILNTFKRDVKDFEETGEVSDELHNALYDYYFDDMPYGTKKARDGDPYEWVADRFGADLGIDGYGSNSPGVPDEDYGLERESVMHGDYAEEASDPYITHKSDYPEYADPLSKILKIAGVGPQNNPAPDYETGVTDEGVLGTLGGGAIGTMVGGPIGGIIGAGIGQAATDGGSSIIEQDEEETDEGWKGQLAGGTAGTLAGGALGAAGGPIGVAVGGALGGTAGQMIGDKLGGTEETDESDLGTAVGAGIGGTMGGLGGAVIGGTAGHFLTKDETDEGIAGGALGGALGGIATKSAKGAMAGAKLGSAIQDRFSKKDDAKKDDTSPLAGQYGHSGKMKEVSKDTSFLDRLKELSGMRK